MSRFFYASNTMHETLVWIIIAFFAPLRMVGRDQVLRFFGVNHEAHEGHEEYKGFLLCALCVLSG